MTFKPKTLFLIDCLGALFSAFLLGIVLVQFEAAIGMPQKALHFLSIIACVFAIYSMANYLFFPKNWKLYLKIIAYANAFYCCMTIGLTVYFYKAITILGWVYFVGEICVILTLVRIELQTADKYSLNSKPT